MASDSVTKRCSDEYPQMVHEHLIRYTELLRSTGWIAVAKVRNVIIKFSIKRSFQRIKDLGQCIYKLLTKLTVYQQLRQSEHDCMITQMCALQELLVDFASPVPFERCQYRSSIKLCHTHNCTSSTPTDSTTYTWPVAIILKQPIH